MKLKWYGHSAFRLITNDGTRIIFDPYEPNAYQGGISYTAITDPADIVLTSHEHADHGYAKGISGHPMVVKGPGNHTPKGVHIKGVATYHDKSRGKERGHNTVFVIEVDGLRLCHLGDLGHELSPSDASLIGPIDVLLSPIGGFFTIDAGEAWNVAQRLQPKLFIPMHYKTGKCGFPIGDIKSLIFGKENVQKFNQSEIDITPTNLPQELEIWVIQHAN